MTAGEDAERRAGVAHVGEIKQTVDDWNRVVQRHHSIDDEFRQLIENENNDQPADDELPLRAQAAAPEACTAAQRGARLPQANWGKLLMRRLRYFLFRALRLLKMLVCR